MNPVTPRFDKLARVATALLLLLAVAAFARGWLRSEMLAKVPWEAAGAKRVLALSAGYWMVVAAIIATGRGALGLKVIAVALLAMAALAGPMAVLSPIFLLASGTALGYGILSRDGTTPPAAIELPLCAALGLGIVAALLVPLSVWPVNTPFVYFVLLALPLLWQGRAAGRLVAGGLLRPHDLDPRELLLLGAIGNIVMIFIVSAMLPEVGNDALAFHLLIAEHVRDFGAWHYDVQRNVLATMPIAVDLLYAGAAMFGGEAAARLLNVAALLLTLGLVYAAVRERGDRGAALLAVLIAAASPIAFLESASLFIDNAWALFVVGSLLAFLQFARGGDPIRLVAGGTLLGAALAAKTIAAAAFPAVGVLLLLAWKQQGRRFPWGALIVAMLLGVALALPSYAIAYAKTGNPVFPFMNSIFRSPHFTPFDFEVFPGSLHPLLLYRMTFYSDQYIEGLPGSFGFTLLLLLPPILVAAAAFGRREGAALIFAVLSFALVVLVGVAYYLRYLYPATFLLAIAFGFALSGLRARGGLLPAALTMAALAGAAASLLFLPAAFAPARQFELAPLVDGEAAHAYVSKWAAQRHVVPVLNGFPDDLGVAFLGGKPFFAGLKRRAYVDSSYIRTFSGRVKALKTDEDLLKLIRDFDLGYLVLDPSEERRLRGLVERVATPLLSLPSGTAYRVDTRSRFAGELLRGEGLRVAEGAWNRHGDPVQDPATGITLVNVDDVLWQRVPVTGGDPYRYAVEMRCHREPADVRLQVIWHAEDGSTRLNYRTAACLPDWTEEETVFTAPKNAVAAVAFAIGHDKPLVEVRSVSLRAR